MRLIFEIGDKVRINRDWRMWKNGDTATVVDTQMERSLNGNQLVMLKADRNYKAQEDARLVYAYMVDIAN